MIFISFWVVAIFTTSGNLLYSSVIGFSQIFKIAEHKTLTFPLLPIVFFIAIYPNNIFQTFDYADLLSKVAATLISFVSILYYLIAVIWDKKGDERN